MGTAPALQGAIIGSFLRQQRQRADPDAFPVLGQRRRHVPHLTQADLAQLAGVSEAAIAQIESSRYPNLNANMLSRISQALKLEPMQHHYLLSLLSGPSGYYSVEDEIPARVKAVVDTAEPNPAAVVNACFDILYWNGGATSMIGDFSRMPPDGRNVIVNMFSMPESKALWVDWADYVVHLVAGLKMQYSRVPDYRERISRLVTKMTLESEEFARLWESVDPFIIPPPEKEIDHPVAGRLRLYQTVSEVVGAPHLFIIQFTPRDDESAAALYGLQASPGPA
jgi:transcriptional regulator with XRE-family HTH domain